MSCRPGPEIIQRVSGGSQSGEVSLDRNMNVSRLEAVSHLLSHFDLTRHISRKHENRSVQRFRVEICWVHHRSPQSFSFTNSRLAFDANFLTHETEFGLSMRRQTLTLHLHFETTQHIHSSLDSSPRRHCSTEPDYYVKAHEFTKRRHRPEQQTIQSSNTQTSRPFSFK